MTETYIVGKYNAIPAEPDESDPRGLLWMWEQPRKDATYILGVDPTNAINMPGWTRQLRTKDDFRTDNSAIEVFRVGEPDVQVAEWAGPLDAESLAVVVNFIGKLYGESQEDGQALTCIEMQPGNGWMTHRELVNRFGYHNYPPWIVESGGLTQKMTAKVGWYSSSSTRRDLWIRGANHLNKRKAILRSPWLVEEMVDCKPDNFLAVTARSMGGRHDDRCFPKGTLIRVRGGDKPIEHVQPCDQVLSHDAKWHRVERVGARWVDEPLVLFDVWGLHENIRSTQEHPFYVRRRRGSSPVRLTEPAWVKAKDIRKGDFLYVPKRPLRPRLSLTDDELYLIGWYLADGSVSGNNIRFVFGGKEEACAQRISRILSEMAAQHPTTWQRYGKHQRRSHHKKRTVVSKITYKNHEKYIYVSCVSQWIANFLTEWAGKRATKCVHPDIRDSYGTLPFVLGFLEGDGSQNKRRGALEGTQLRAHILFDVQRILIDHGIWATVLRSKGQQRGYKGDSNTRLHIGAPWVNVLLTRVYSSRFKFVERTVGHPMAREDTAGFWVPIREIRQEPYRGYVHNLSVEDSQSYVANDVAVHNCVAMLLALWTAHEWAIGAEPSEPNTLDSAESKNWQASAISLEAMTDEWNDRFAQLLGDD